MPMFAIPFQTIRSLPMLGAILYGIAFFVMMLLLPPTSCKCAAMPSAVWGCTRSPWLCMPVGLMGFLIPVDVVSLVYGDTDLGSMGCRHTGSRPKVW